MVLDDSDDDTVELLGNAVDDYKKKDFKLNMYVEELEKDTKQVL